jgi:hypothetical protein
MGGSAAEGAGGGTAEANTKALLSAAGAGFDRVRSPAECTAYLAAVLGAGAAGAALGEARAERLARRAVAVTAVLRQESAKA